MLCAYPLVRKDAAKVRKKNDICKFFWRKVKNSMNKANQAKKISKKSKLCGKICKCQNIFVSLCDILCARVKCTRITRYIQREMKQ